ncbi:MAG: hypothetical protein IRY99_20180 [Isosphaeraceae bacterium]|nr:hypothetical protein [Isosphaeraceae bacterium]
MARRVRSIREMRALHEAAEARGLIRRPEPGPRPAAPPTERRPKPVEKSRMKVVWAVCDIGGRTVATFDYPRKAEAEALAAQLKAQGKGTHFVRSVKEPM